MSNVLEWAVWFSTKRQGQADKLPAVGIGDNSADSPELIRPGFPVPEKAEINSPETYHARKWKLLLGPILRNASSGL